MSIFHEIRTAIFQQCMRLYSQMVGQAGSPIRIVYVDIWPWPNPRSRSRCNLGVGRGCPPVGRICNRCKGCVAMATTRTRNFSEYMLVLALFIYLLLRSYIKYIKSYTQLYSRQIKNSIHKLITWEQTQRGVSMFNIIAALVNSVQYE